MSERKAANGPPLNGLQKGGLQAAERAAAMEKLWADAAQKFKDICGESLLQRNSTVRSFDGVRVAIEKNTDEAAAADAKQKDKWDRAKSLGLTSLKYLTMLVGAASQAASFVPVPSSAASIATSALTFVFSIPASIHNYNEAIDQVFSEVASSLAQFQIYSSMDLKEDIDPALIQQIHDVMASFVRLCAHVVKYKQGGVWSRTLRKLKTSLLDDDSGLSDEMATFHRMLQHQRDVEGTLTLAVVVDTRRDVAVLLVQLAMLQVAVQQAADETRETHQVAAGAQRTVQSLRDDADRLQTLNKIRDTLDVLGTVRLDTNTTQTCTNLFARCLDGTGAWIWDHPVYAAWTAVPAPAPAPATLRAADDISEASPAPHAPHVLVLSGPPSSGKTSACALITKRLEEGQAARSYVAHYFFSPNTKKSEEDKNPVQVALKYMAFQIARVDPTVRRALGKACDAGPAAFRRAGGLENLGALWAELKVGAPVSGGATHTLVFDGLENLAKEQVRMLIQFALSLKTAGQAVNINTASAPNGRVRILMSGLDELFDDDLPSSILRIRMEDNSTPDMRRRIEDELAKQGMLQRCRPGSIQQKAHDAIMDKLPGKVHGSYSQLQFELDEVVRLLSMRKKLEELVTILDTTTSSHEAAIQALQRSLAPHEIHELNELLKWVLFAADPLMLDELEAAMFLATGAESLVSLQYVIRSKYGAVLKLDDDFVIAQDGAKEYLQNEEAKLANQSVQGEGRPSISMTIRIKNVDQETCEDFLWDLTQKAIRERFKFEFGTAARSSRASISANELAAHQTIVQRTFDFLSAPPSKQTAVLGMYVVTQLPYHLGALHKLEEANDRNELAPADRAEIGSQLYKLFHDEEVVRRHKAIFARTYWTVPEMEEIQKWLIDTQAMRKVVDLAWRDSVRRATSPTEGFMRVLGRMVVHGLVRSRDWKVLNAMYWIDCFMEADQKRKNQQSSAEDSKPASSPPDDDSSSGGDDWKAISEWCQSFLNLRDAALDSLWYERIAEAALLRDRNASVALDLYRRAVALPNPSWKCYSGMARAYAAQQKESDALANIELALEGLAQPDASPQPEAKKVAELHLLAGRYATQNGHIERAAQHFEAACTSVSTSTSTSTSTDADQILRGKLGLLRARLVLLGRAGAPDMLKEILAADDGESTLAGMLKLVARESYHADLIGKMFVAAGGDVDLMQRIVRALEAAAAPVDAAAKTTAGGDDEEDGEEEEDDDEDDDDDDNDNDDDGDHDDDDDDDDEDNSRFIEDETRGVLLYYQGEAAYRFGVALPIPGAADGSGGGDPINAALRLWAASRALLQDVGGDNAYGVRQKAAMLPAQHYFHRLQMDRDRGGSGSSRQDYMDALLQLAAVSRNNSDDSDSHVTGLLGALHAWRGDVAQSHATLRPRFLPALRMLYDATLSNDHTGFSQLNEVLVHGGDLSNAAAAWCLFSQEDIVRSALHFDADDVIAAAAVYEADVMAKTADSACGDGDIVDRNKALDVATRLGTDIVAHVHGKEVPDASEQVQRIQLAKKQIDALMEQELGKETDGATVVAYRLVQQRLAGIHDEHTPEVDLAALPTNWNCDGRNPDGTPCDYSDYFSGELYHCLYCWNIDFCRRCLDRLRGLSPGWEASSSASPSPNPLPAATPYGEQMVCSPRHQWLRCPVMGRDTSVGLRAASVRVPGVKPTADKSPIWEMRFDLDGTGKGAGSAPWVTIDDWKAGLAKEWGIELSDLMAQPL